MKKINLKKKIVNLKTYLFAFFVPFFLCLLIFYFKDVFQNIENFYVSDLMGQHFTFLNYLKNVLLGDVSIFYSFYAGMGSPMLSTIIFYCISPINLLLLIIDDIRCAILFIYIIKVSLAGVTMFVLLKSKKNADRDLITIIFSSCYALCAFVINYFFCIFWFDVLYLAPLVMLGIDRIVKYKKMNLLYIFSLALAIMCNIQMGFGLCVYSVIYYFYSFSLQYNLKSNLKQFKHFTFIFIISSLCAGAISSGVLLGFIADYKDVFTARNVLNSTMPYVSNLGYILKNLFTVGNFKVDYYNDYEPYIYCGLIVSFFSCLYLFNKDIDKRKRKCAFFVILIFLISFCIGFLNLFWHLSFPILLNFRYSIYLSLFLTMLAYENYLTIGRLVKRDIIILSILLFIGFFMIVGYSSEIYFFWTGIFLILIFVLILLTKNKTKKFEVLLCFTVLSEIFMNGYLSIYTSKDIPNGKYSSYEYLKELGNLNDFDDNYRVMYNYSYTDFTNDTLLLNKNSSLRYFSSVIDGDVLTFFDRNFSSVGNNNYRISVYDSPLLISLMGNKYMYLTGEFNNSIYKKVNSYKINSYNYKSASNKMIDVYLYENPYSLSLGYVIEKDVDFKKGMNLVDYQNKIIKSFSGNDEDVLVLLDHEIIVDNDICNKDENNELNCKTFEITNNTDNVLVYIYTVFERYNASLNAKSFFDIGRPLLLSSIDDKVKFNGWYAVDNLDDIEFYAVTYDEANLIENLNILKENMLENIQINGNMLTGEINSNKNGILFLSIPYNDKFKIYIDNEEVNYYSLLDDTFIGVDLNEGNHDIVVKYVDKNYKWYIVSTVLSIIVTFILLYFVNKYIGKKQEERAQEELDKNKKFEKMVEDKIVKKTQLKDDKVVKSNKKKNKSKKRK